MTTYVDKTPPINVTGTYILRAPWSVGVNDIYRCEAIDGFEALIERGVDVFNEYYVPKAPAVTITDYNRDKVAGINIITLMSSGGDTIYVPSSYILKYPNELNVPYGRIVIALDLGPLPSDFPLDDIKFELASVATTMVGNTGILVSSHILPMAGVVDVNTARDLNLSRVDSIKDNITMYASKILSEEQNQKLNTKIAGLEEIIISRLS